MPVRTDSLLAGLRHVLREGRAHGQAGMPPACAHSPACYFMGLTSLRQRARVSAGWKSWAQRLGAVTSLRLALSAGRWCRKQVKQGRNTSPCGAGWRTPHLGASINPRGPNHTLLGPFKPPGAPNQTQSTYCL
ncbi:hypothetical protein NDU88_000562 [Pleurodeles waltl]|uniref:Uncharacterized protein n=1 Tax=Pleurodeles waltl TaxID=8319 RepID=A0AAV7LV64_PLEWA|nr:hypothetical protein NDU88_000562 [Pleurodeles waltl]